MATYAPFAHPLYVMLKPAGARCNLACDYCYYLEKSGLYKASPAQEMSDSLLEKFTKEYIESQSMPQVLFTWHGGETLIRPLSFYKKALEYQRRYAGGRTIDNCIQTNGTMLTEEWCRFLHDNHWLVGVSIDGPKRFHDAYRKNRKGSPSFDRVMQGIHLLDKYHVEWNAMAVVNNLNADYPLEFYHFFKSIGCHYIQFTPVVERILHHSDGRHLASLADSSGSTDTSGLNEATPTQEATPSYAGSTSVGEHSFLAADSGPSGQASGATGRPTDLSAQVREPLLADFSITPEQWGRFTCAIFDEWVRNDVGRYFVQLFDATLANWIGEQPGVCSLAKTCGHAGVMEFNGDVYSCDHFVFPEYKLGNIYNETLVEMMYGKKQLDFGYAKQAGLPAQCRECRYHFACNGECPKNRFCRTASGEPSLNYLCRGYYQFFDHVAPYMDFMRNEILAKRAPANIMDALKVS